MTPFRAAAAAAEADRRQVQLCTFRVGGQDYAVDIMRVLEIIPPAPLTPVPEAPAWVAGVFRLRGDVIPVIDLHRRLGLPPVPATRRAKVVVVRVDGRLLGLQVDEVCEVIRLERAELRPAPAVTDAAGSRLFLGVCGGERQGARAGRRAGASRMRLLLNVKALLDPAAGDGVEAGRALLEAGEDA